MFNKPTMHTFLWEGLDGTRLFTHFPPADTYNADAKVEDVLKAATNYHGALRHPWCRSLSIETATARATP